MERTIKVQGLTKRYAGRAVVDDLSFEVLRGEVLAVLGPNGAGKTTTVEILEGYRARDTGVVEVLGVDPARAGATLKRRIGLMLQDGGLYPAIKPLEALRLFAAFYPRPRDPVELLHVVGLEDAANTTFRQLSGGQKQRLSLALALVGHPEVVFLDEPTAGMDPEARRSTWQIIRELKAKGVTVLLTTHSMEEAERLADRVLILDRGRLLTLDSPAALARLPSEVSGIRFSADPGLPLDALTEALGARSSAEQSPGEYVVYVEASPARLAVLATWLAERNILARDISVDRGSLEEVFLRLTTGQRTED